jgi:hypothetical protein
MIYRIILLMAMVTPVWADKLMKDCKPRKSMPCISRNGLCVDVSIDGHPSLPISKADRKRVIKLPDMGDVCWQVESAVSSQFRVNAKSGGMLPTFVGALKSLSIGNINEHFNGWLDRFATGFISGNTEKALDSQFPNDDFDFSNKLQRTKLAVDLFRQKYDEL